MRAPRPTTVPGFSTLPQPTSTPSPSMAPNLRIEVSTRSPPARIVTGEWSCLRFEVIAPAPVCAL